MYVTWLFKWVLVYSGLVDVTGNEKQIVQQVKKRFLKILFLNACLILETKSGQLMETVLQLESRNLNSVFSNYLAVTWHVHVFQTQNHFSWIWPSVIHYQVFHTRAILNYFLFSLRVWNNGGLRLPIHVHVSVAVK